MPDFCTRNITDEYLMELKLEGRDCPNYWTLRANRGGISVAFYVEGERTCEYCSYNRIAKRRAFDALDAAIKLFDEGGKGMMTDFEDLLSRRSQAKDDWKQRTEGELEEFKERLEFKYKVYIDLECGTVDSLGDDEVPEILRQFVEKIPQKLDEYFEPGELDL